jgi:FAD:protein FMN transferase
MLIRKYAYAIAFFITVVIFFAIFSASTQSKTRLMMGTFVEIKLSGFKWYDFDRAFENSFQAIADLEKMVNIYDNESELSMLNLTAYDKPYKTSDELFSILRSLKAVYSDTNGVFDITIGPLAKLWKAGIKAKNPPDEHAIRQALFLTGVDNLVLDQRKNTVLFKKKGMIIDLGACAKGYAVDKAVNEIKKSGFSSAMINAGGDIFCVGRKNFFSPWRVGIRDPENKDSIVRVLNISDKAAATSGGYEQFFLYGDKYYSHLIDPGTGYPSDSGYVSVTVIAENCFTADTLATAIFIGGSEIKSKLETLYPEIEVIAIEKHI